MTNGKSNRAGDLRFHGRGDNNTRTVSKDKNDATGDKRLKKKPVGPASAGSRLVPIAATIGQPLAKADNGGGTRIASASMMKAGM